MHQCAHLMMAGAYLGWTWAAFHVLRWQIGALKGDPHCHCAGGQQSIPGAKGEQQL